MSYLFIFLHSSWSTSQLQHDTSSLPKALQAREGTHFVCVHAPTGKPDPHCSRACSLQDVSLNYCQQTLDRALRTQTHRMPGHVRPASLGEVKLITLPRPPAVCFSSDF